MHPMELLGVVGHVESRFGLLGDNVGVGASRCPICAKRTTGSEIILDIMMVLLCDDAQVELVLFCLEIVLSLSKIGAWFAPNVP